MGVYLAAGRGKGTDLAERAISACVEKYEIMAEKLCSRASPFRQFRMAPLDPDDGIEIVMQACTLIPAATTPSQCKCLNSTSRGVQRM